MEKEEFTKKELKDLAELVARCRKDRLPYVLAILKEAGADIHAMSIASESARLASADVANSRKNIDKSKWSGTTNKTVLRMRKYYEDGMNMYSLSRVTGINRTSLYMYMWGSRGISQQRERIINEGLDDLEELARQEDDETA